MGVSSFLLVCRLVLRLLPTKHTKEHEALSANHLFIRVVGVFRGQLLSSIPWHPRYPWSVFCFYGLVATTCGERLFISTSALTLWIFESWSLRRRNNSLQIALELADRRFLLSDLLLLRVPLCDAL